VERGGERIRNKWVPGEKKKIGFLGYKLGRKKGPSYVTKKEKRSEKIHQKKVDQSISNRGKIAQAG